MPDRQVPLRTIVSAWARVGCLGFGGPPAHVAMLRERCVDQEDWIPSDAFERAFTAANLLPGPSSTQLAILLAHRLAGPAGAIAGGLAFVLPGLVAVLGLAVVMLSGPPDWVRGAGAGAAAAVPLVAIHAGRGLIAPSLEQARRRARWFAYLVAGGAAAALAGPWLVVVLLACGGAELAIRGGARPPALGIGPMPLAALPLAAASGGLGALCWTALKAGALSYGGGFVIVPLMRSDAVTTFGWLTDAEFSSAVAIGQVTPGPVLHTIAAVGYGAHGIGGALLATAVAFAPSFLFVLLIGARWDRIAASDRAQAFLGGAGPAAIGGILGAAVPLATALSEPWQWALAAVAGAALLLGGRGVVTTLLACGAAGAAIALAGGPIPL